MNLTGGVCESRRMRGVARTTFSGWTVDDMVERVDALRAERDEALGKQRDAAADLRACVEALSAASEHLEYCGYGDEYEREGARQRRLPEMIAAALARPGVQGARKEET